MKTAEEWALEANNGCKSHGHDCECVGNCMVDVATYRAAMQAVRDECAKVAHQERECGKWGDFDGEAYRLGCTAVLHAIRKIEI